LPGWLQTAVLLIAVSGVARITGVSPALRFHLNRAQVRMEMWPPAASTLRACHRRSVETYTVSVGSPCWWRHHGAVCE
jgi:hypothetical protein